MVDSSILEFGIVDILIKLFCINHSHISVNKKPLFNNSFFLYIKSSSLAISEGIEGVTDVVIFGIGLIIIFNNPVKYNNSIPYCAFGPNKISQNSLPILSLLTF